VKSLRHSLLHTKASNPSHRSQASSALRAVASKSELPWVKAPSEIRKQAILTLLWKIDPIEIDGN
jgi:hypothetical protein